jgi:hypothetical protein
MMEEKTIPDEKDVQSLTLDKKTSHPSLNSLSS